MLVCIALLLIKLHTNFPNAISSIFLGIEKRRDGKGIVTAMAVLIFLFFPYQLGVGHIYPEYIHVYLKK